MNDTEFWNKIEKMEWNSDFNYDRISEELLNGKYGNKKEQIELLKKFKEKTNILYEIVDNMSNTEYSKYIEKGDDGLSDTIAHIIGNGKKAFDSVVENIKNFEQYADNYKESFAYAFLPLYDLI